MKYSLLMLLFIAGCTIGTSTTQRPALSRPAIAPDGTFWDAVEVARTDNAEGFLHVLSPNFVHGCFLPRKRLSTPENQQDFNDLRDEVNASLADGATRNKVDLAAEKTRMAHGYMRLLRNLVEDRFIEVGKPDYDIQYQDEYDRAYGPNRATVIVTVNPKGRADSKSGDQVIRVSFVQDGYRWLIDSLEPDANKGSYAWTK
ncbi:MAG: hypothetical protein IPK87_02320 [Planctomycetes bacterium]|nr:hypothetical protein [Planctomycetota bacterium]